ncbi:MAG: CDP-alcohol phosphatidyltransferase family protein [Ahrensia sp.]
MAPDEKTRAPLTAFIIAALAGVPVIAALAYMLPNPGQFAGFAIGAGLSFYTLACALIGYYLLRSYPHARLGLCNIVTLMRLMLVAVLFAALVGDIAPNWVLFCIAVFALALDGVDGWLARRQGLASDFGARFDVEVDAAFALLLAIYAATQGAAGFWVILLGVPHYLFAAARLMLPWLNGALRPSIARKAVCVFQIATLIALQIPFFEDGQLNILIAAVVLALVWSFGRDILWLWRTQK